MICRKTLLTLLLLAYSAASTAAFELRYRTGGFQGLAASEQIFLIQDGKLRVSYTANNYYLYDAVSKQLWMVDSANKTYMPIGTDIIRKSRETMAKQKQTLQKLLADAENLPPKARASIEKSLQTIAAAETNSVRLDNRRVEAVSFSATEKTAEISRHSCRVYKAVAKSSKADVCFAEASALGMSGLDINVFNRYQQHMAKISGFNPYYALQAAKLPLSVMLGSETVVELQSVSRKKLPQSHFEIPASYRSAMPDTR